MARKNKTLPKDFAEIVQRGDLSELKAVFDKCDINAYERYGSKNALGFKGLKKEFVLWAVDQGADLNFTKEKRSLTPLCYQVQYKSNKKFLTHLVKEGLLSEKSAQLQLTNDNSDIVELFIELGAEVDPETYHNPLEQACIAVNPSAVKILLKHGANPIGYGSGQNPLEDVLNRLYLVPDTLAVSELLLDAGVPVTKRMQDLVRLMGKRYQADKQSYDHIKNAKQILDKLYELFNVEPVQAISKHDSVSDITVTQDNLDDAFSELWEYLVPTRNQANTMQGEAIRLTGKISGELYRNGGRNWDKRFQDILDSLEALFQTGNPLTGAELEQAKSLIKQLYHGNQHKYAEAVALTHLAVKWVKRNPKPIKRV